ncbi:L-gulonolactone oxidase 3 [Mercurialis annua]|uniref:L-gulonolactone oxidase 3 n=1 Tax=Mercurialis annua TaxID=3986 RepID=UPI00215E0A3E|nr:L-gulonolactone oxidase 3 [Mercurialis annua]
MYQIQYLLWCFICLLYLVHRSPTTVAMPPQPPVRCNDGGCALYNSYGVWNDRKECHIPNVTYPSTEEELRLAVAYANRKKLKIKVVSRFSHTIPKLACPGSHNFSNSMLISTSNYNSLIDIDRANLAVTVDAGVSLRELIDRVEAAGLSLTAAPYWEGVSIGGVISTAAHGSSWWGKGGGVHDHVIGMSVIVPATESQGFAKIMRIGAQDSVLKAVKVSLGLLGVISKVKLSLEPAFKRSITYNFTKDDQIEDIFMDHGKQYEFGDITWYPSKHTAVYRYDSRVPLNTSGDGKFDFLGFQSNSILVSQSTRTAEKLLENARNVKGKCLMASTFIGFKKLVGNGLKNNGLTFTGYPVIGHQGKIQASGSCLYSPEARIDTSCAWDPRIKGLFFYESTTIFPASKFRDFIRDVKKLRDIKPENFCGVDIYNGLLIRFIKASDAYLGQSEDSVVVDFNYYRADDSSTPRMNQDVWEEIEQMAFFKYGAKPHWAKNRNLAFLNVQSKYPNFSKFVAAKKQLDPQNMFSSEWSDEILFGKDRPKGDGCALEGQCICSEDRHCSPSKGYFCRAGLVYTEARVCRDISSSII